MSERSSESPVQLKKKRKHERSRSSKSPVKRHRKDTIKIEKTDDRNSNRHQRNVHEDSQPRQLSNDRRQRKEKHRNDKTTTSNISKDRQNYDRDRIEHKLKIKQEEIDTEGKWGSKEETAAPNKEKPNLKTSGKLTEDTNTFKGVVIKYNEPPEGRKPKKRWRWYPFKGTESLPVLHLHRQSAYLLGRDRRIADIPVDHPSCSKQHAALQFPMVPFEREDGSTGRRIRPYIIDLESANGTYVNNVRIEARRYVELREKDVVKFGFSKRDYVLLHDSSDKTLFDDEDVNN